MLALLLAPCAFAVIDLLWDGSRLCSNFSSVRAGARGGREGRRLWSDGACFLLLALEPCCVGLVSLFNCRRALLALRTNQRSFNH
jgi:hypothetical protein